MTHQQTATPLECSAPLADPNGTRGISMLLDQDIDWRALPPKMMGFKEVLGPEAALALCEAHGGASLYVPQNARPNHALAAVLGKQGFETFTRNYGGERLDIPKLDAVHRQLRKRSIKNARSQGRSIASLATEHNLSRRRILQLLAE